MAIPSFITVRFPGLPNVPFEYNPDEPMWSFCQRVGGVFTQFLEDEGATMKWGFNYERADQTRVLINTFAKRLEPMKNLVLDPTKPIYAGLLWDLSEYRGNASPEGGERMEFVASQVQQIQINFVGSPSIKMEYNPEQPMWSFCQEVGRVFPEFLAHEGTTMVWSFNYRRENGELIPLNTFEKRLEPMKNLVVDPTSPIHAYFQNDFSPHSHFLYKGNAAQEAAGDRTGCSICLGDMLAGIDLQEEDPSAPWVLKCNHAFHLGCISDSAHTQEFTCHDGIEVSPINCPVCRTRIDDTMTEMDDRLPPRVTIATLYPDAIK